MNEHLNVLSLAERDALPESIDEQSSPNAKVVRELVEAGYLWAIDASSLDEDAYLSPRMTLAGREYLGRLKEQIAATDRDLLLNLDRLRSALVSVSTGGQMIDNVNSTYRQIFLEVDSALKKKGIANPIQFEDLWDWHGRWSSGDLPTYKSRREFVAALFNPLLARIRGNAQEPVLSQVGETGWLRVDRAVHEIRRRLAEAKTEEQYQAVGLLCREILISLAQAVHDPIKHPPLDEIKPSETDAKRMLEAYIAVEFAGSAHEEARRHAKAAYNLATNLQHRRTANFREAAMCAEATGSIVNVIAIVSGHRDPP